MSFEPLSFFEPDTKVKRVGEQDEIETFNLESQNTYEKVTEEGPKDEEANFVPLEVLDLPTISTSLPTEVITTVLKLLQPEQVKNFGNQRRQIPSLFTTEELQEYLNSKHLTMVEVVKLSEYIGHNLKSTLTITQLPTCSSSEVTAYLTKIIACPFLNLTEEERNTIYDLASFVMTANFAPALKGNTTRMVQIDGLEREILLYEPALTEDKVGNITWGASLELAKLIVDGCSEEWISNKETTILELGAGTGLVTIVLGILMHKVVSTDLPEIIDNLSKNIMLNKLHCTLSQSFETFDDTSLINVTSLDWRDPLDFLQRTHQPEGYKTIVISDPVYSSQHPYWVQKAVNATLSKDDSSRVVFMVGQRDRFQDVRDNLWRLMIESGLKVISEKVINGFDDYGELPYDYKVFGWN
ncbi:Protein-lysine N-methyltransferase EFM2 [Pichia kudriavzevii]|uniref:Protein-lysine N-methyltransferase EFM2 n=1 Tax=Pichia kudriavzevii TaxID=4909 RepID=A0A1V2LP95_PICKU|nr:Protein-lysine N-methyltransferase EFM2 [Pichia kudriavzevii]